MLSKDQSRNASCVDERTTYPSQIRTILAVPGQLTTPLFSRVKPPSTFLGPPIAPAALAKRVISAIDSGKNAEIAMPFYADCIASGVWGVLPRSLKGKFMRGLVGLDKAGWEVASRNKSRD